jgi:peptidoglycan/LPS O-acetylase OafA/YrhL
MKPGVRLSTNLDVLRAFAVLLVLICHLFGITRTGNAHVTDGLGRFGVILFFVHTSCVLMASLESLHSGGQGWLSRFYVRRAFRIYPLAILLILTAIMFGSPAAPWIGPDHPPYTASVVISNLLLMQNVAGQPPVIGVLWSLPLEVQMYIVLPVVFLMMRSRNWGRKMIALWIGAVLLIPSAKVGAQLLFHGSHKFDAFEFIPCFLSGAIAYKLSRPAKPSPWPSFLWLPLLLVVIAGGGFCAFWAPGFWACCLLLSLAFTRIADMGKNVFTSLCHLIATYSYGIYLVHSFALWIFFKLIGSMLVSTPLRMFASLLFTALASVALFHFVEDPMIRVGKRLTEFRSRPREVTAATSETAAV